MTVTFRGVLPVIDPDRGRRCLASMHPDLYARLVAVDNTATGMDPTSEWNLPWLTIRREEPAPVHGYNMGVAASWNIGRSFVVKREHDAVDYLVIVSAGVEFGLHGGAEFLEALEDRPWPGLWSQHGWHLCAIARDVLETVGEFDEGFWPGYYEDTDYLYRMGLAGLPSPRENGQPFPQLVVDAEVPEVGHSIPWARPDFAWLSWRYRTKWGGDQGSETYTEPWGGVEVPEYPGPRS